MLPVPSAVGRSSVGWLNPIKSADQPRALMQQLVGSVLTVGSGSPQ